VPIAGPEVLGASPEVPVASPEVLDASPGVPVASLEALGASPEVPVASSEVLVAIVEVSVASVEAPIAAIKRAIFSTTGSFESANSLRTDDRKAEQADAPNPRACGTFGTSPAGQALVPKASGDR
jgi:hypothetical protein